MSFGVGSLPARYRAVAAPAIVESNAVPSEPPICCDALTEADATPASSGWTPIVALLMEVDITSPSPAPTTTRAGRMRVVYEERTPI